MQSFCIAGDSQLKQRVGEIVVEKHKLLADAEHRRNRIYSCCTGYEKHEMFAGLGLDPSLVQAAKRRGFRKPTEVQEKAVPAFLRGQDVLALSKTGSGKTLAFILPILHKLLAIESDSAKLWSVLVLVPTKELCLQLTVLQTFNEFSLILKTFPTTLKVCCASSVHFGKKESGHVIISTPRVISRLLRQSSCCFQIENVSMLVVDEADLILSYGYHSDMKFICPKVPRGCQCMMTSATESVDLDSIVKLTLERPLRIDLLSQNQVLNLELVLHQYIMCPAEDRLVYLLALLRFQSLQNLVLVFVNTIRMGYTTHLLLKQFGIKSSLLHGELPVNFRNKCINDFNRKVFETLIVVDDMESKDADEEDDKERKGKKKELEFGASRGLDFVKVKTVVNIDLPTTLNGYIHRVGRTGRAENTGLALSFFSTESSALFSELKERLREGDGTEEAFKAFQSYNTHQVKSLHYRAQDVISSITKRTIAEARLEDLRKEMLTSTKLEGYFVAHPLEKTMLESIGEGKRKRRFSGISKLPSYITGSSDIDTPKVTRPRMSEVLRKDPLEGKALRRRKTGRHRLRV